jgi:hypothetical protein
MLQRSGSMPRSRAAYSTWPLASLFAVALAGCGVYSFSGGGGMPSHIDTIAILPFDNQTTQFTLTQELTQAMSDEVPGRLGLKPGAEGTADAVLRGTITRYNERATNYQQDPVNPGPVVFQRRVDIAIDVEIFDVAEDKVLWSSRSLSAFGEYLPDSQTELVGRQIAIENLIQKILDGAQSQW